MLKGVVVGGIAPGNVDCRIVVGRLVFDSVNCEMVVEAIVVAVNVGLDNGAFVVRKFDREFTSVIIFCGTSVVCGDKLVACDDVFDTVV